MTKKWEDDNKWKRLVRIKEKRRRDKNAESLKDFKSGPMKEKTRYARSRKNWREYIDEEC
jgi:hypothetical protein